MDWFPRFLADHVRRNPHSQFPDSRTNAEAARVFFEGWRNGFWRYSVTEAEAVDASTWMTLKPGVFPGEHLNMLLMRINARRADAAIEAGARQRLEVQRQNAREAEELQESLKVWHRLPEARRGEIRAAVVADYPVLEVMRNERYTTLICLAELQTRLGSEEGGAP